MDLRAASSIAVLVEIAVKSYRAASQLIKDVRKAPLSRLTRQLDILHCGLALWSELEQKAM
jgi:hypothetical protein